MSYPLSRKAYTLGRANAGAGEPRGTVVSDRELRRTPNGYWQVVALHPAVVAAGLAHGLPMHPSVAIRRYPQHAQTILDADLSR